MERQQEITLERLRIIIVDHGEPVDQVELDDPRQKWVDGFNEQWSGVGLEAKVA